MSEVGSGGSACGSEQDLSPGGILWKAGAPKKTSLVKEKGSMYVCYECFYECICDAHMCTQGHRLMCKGVCVCVCVCVCVRLIDPSLPVGVGEGPRRQPLIRRQLMGPNGRVSKG